MSITDTIRDALLSDTAVTDLGRRALRAATSAEHTYAALARESASMLDVLRPSRIVVSIDFAGLDALRVELATACQHSGNRMFEFFHEQHSLDGALLVLDAAIARVAELRG